MIFVTLKRLWTSCFKKGAILMLPWRHSQRIFTISMFYEGNSCKQWQIKIKEDSGHILGRPINIVASFAEHLKL